jgi:hypothetical protein
MGAAASAQTVDTSPHSIIQVETNLPMDYARVDVNQRDGTYAVCYMAQAPIGGYPGLERRTAELMVMQCMAYWGRRDFPQQEGQRLYLSGVYRTGSSYFLIRSSTLIYNPVPKTTNAAEPYGQVGTVLAMIVYENSSYWGHMVIRRPSGSWTTYSFLKVEMTFDAVKQPLTESEMRMVLDVALGAPNYVHIDRTVNLGSGTRVFHGGGPVWGSRIVGH